LAKLDGLSRDDLLKSLDELNWIGRAKCAERIAALYCGGALDGAARRIAEDVFRVLHYDSEILVRRLLAECLKQSHLLPGDVALQSAAEGPTPTQCPSPKAALRAHDPGAFSGPPQ